MTIRSKKNNLFNYFAHDHKDLSKQYIKGCETFFKSLNNKSTKKDNSVKTDYFINCRGCKDIITADYRNNFDKRYCKDCT